MCCNVSPSETVSCVSNFRELNIYISGGFSCQIVGMMQFSVDRAMHRCLAGLLEPFFRLLYAEQFDVHLKGPTSNRLPQLGFAANWVQSGLSK